MNGPPRPDRYGMVTVCQIRKKKENVQLISYESMSMHKETNRQAHGKNRMSEIGWTMVWKYI